MTELSNKDLIAACNKDPLYDKLRGALEKTGYHAKLLRSSPITSIVERFEKYGFDVDPLVLKFFMNELGIPINDDQHPQRPTSSAAGLSSSTTPAQNVPPAHLKDLKDLDNWIIEPVGEQSSFFDRKCRLDTDQDSLLHKLGICIANSVGKFGLYTSLGSRSISHVNDIITWLDFEAAKPNYVGSLLFGVSGCGKTRTVLELLCNRVGFFLTCDNRGNGGSPLLKQTIQDANDNASRLMTDARREAASTVLKRFLVSLHLLYERVKRIIPTLSPSQWLFCQLYPHLLTTDGSDPVRRIYNELLHYETVDYLPLLMQRVQKDTGSKALYCVDEAQILLAQRNVNPVRGMMGSMWDSLLCGSGCSFVLSGTGFGLAPVEVAVISGTVKDLTKNDLVFKRFTNFPGFLSVTSMCDFLELGASSEFWYDSTRQSLINSVSTLTLTDVFACLRGRRRFFVSFLAFLDNSAQSNLEGLLKTFVSKQTNPDSASSEQVLTVYQTIHVAHGKLLETSNGTDAWLQTTILPWLSCLYLTSKEAALDHDSVQFVELGVCQLEQLTVDNKFTVSLVEPLVIQSLINLFSLERIVLSALRQASNASAAGFVFEVCQAVEWKALFSNPVTLTELFQDYGFSLKDGPLSDPFDGKLVIELPEIEAKYGLQMPLIEPDQDGSSTKATFASTKHQSAAADLVARLRVVGRRARYIVLSIQIKLRKGHISSDALIKTRALISRDVIPNQLRILACFPGTYDEALFLKDVNALDVLVSIGGGALMTVAMSAMLCEYLLGLHDGSMIEFPKIELAHIQGMNLRKKLNRPNYRQ